MSVNILTINCGSSSLKFSLVTLDPGAIRLDQGRLIVRGVLDRIGGKSNISFISTLHGNHTEESVITDHGEAINSVFEWLYNKRLLGRDGLQAVGHRVVHGGDIFRRAVRIDDTVIGEIESLRSLAPLHNEPALRAIKTAREILGTALPQVAVFDTSFHNRLPDVAATYAIPAELAEKYRIKRYGFHGIAHQYMAERYAELNDLLVSRKRLITLQLGNGCSATAVKQGYSVDTSMGLTPLEGLVMGTRSGDVDPTLPGLLSQKEGVDSTEVENWLNTRSGLLGVSGWTHDMRELLEAQARGDKRAGLAVEMFCYRVRKYIGSYLAVLGGSDAIIFGGGIGENSPVIRENICRGMEWCGLILDSRLNQSAIGSETLISAGSSLIKVYVLPVNEEAIIARETARLLGWLDNMKK